MSAIRVPKGFRLTGVHCGIKRDRDRPDVALVACDGPAAAAGVYTQNRVVAAPVVICRQRTPSDDIRVVVANSGNANACTGEQGLRDAAKMAETAAQSCGANEEQALVMSTGIIGEPLDMQKVARGIHEAAQRLGRDEPSLIAAARGIMTTDKSHKLAGGQVNHDGQPICITGMAKGAGMIGPRMATMLCILMTDASLPASVAQRVLVESVDDTFNCISVEGHTSTNDTVLLLASGAAVDEPLTGASLTRFADCLREVCGELAQAIPNDGEGATHLIEIEVRGCDSREDARQIARTIADSPLVKTAIAGADPNWGRIVSAAGYAGVAFDPSHVELAVNSVPLFRRGSPVPFDAAAVSQSIRSNRKTTIALQLDRGDARIRFWTSDLTAEYVRINADYHT